MTEDSKFRIVCPKCGYSSTIREFICGLGLRCPKCGYEEPDIMDRIYFEKGYLLVLDEETYEPPIEEEEIE